MKTANEDDASLADREIGKGKLDRIAGIFRAFAEPTRLLLLQALRRAEELRVSELVELSGTTQANVSKHLKVLYDVGVLDRRRSGNQTLYAIGDPVVVELLEAVCNKLNRQANELSKHEYSL